MKLPIGIQTFATIKEEDYIYIDKTKEALELIKSYKYVFLSRPRRFGKSLFVDTLQNIFEGQKEHFKGLYIEDKYDFTQKYPIIKISFAGNMSTKEDLIQTMKVMLLINQQRLGTACDKELNPANCLKILIKEVYEKYQQKVVILIDEYDKPILDNITNKEMARFAREELKAFYEVIKDKDEYIRFAFITGVSKFSKVSIFSGFNNLRDISLEPNFGNICGYTHEDVKTSFKPLLKGVDLEKLKSWYNGYYFLKDKIYNPFDVLLFCDSQFMYKNYWFETGTPSFLIKLIKERSYFLPDLENIIIGEEILNSFEVDKINIEVLLFQAGYLTIKEQIQSPRGGISYSLKIPNKEVRISLNNALINSFTDNPTKTNASQDNAYIALQNANLDDFEKALYSLFATIPHENYKRNNIQNYEGFYASVVYVYLASLGLPVHVEQSSNQGQLDMTLCLKNNRYIIEFKMDGKNNALKQIKEKKYYERYENEGSNIFLVGICFDKKTKNIGSFESENWK